MRELYYEDYKMSLTILKNVDDDNEKTYTLLNKNGEKTLQVFSMGKQDDCFYQKGNKVFKPYFLEIRDMETNQVFNISAKDFDLQAVFEEFDFEYSYRNMSESEIKNFLNIWGLGYTTVEIISKDTYECECCGFYTNVSFKIINSKLNKEITFFNDRHFGNSYLPSPYDLFCFILNGDCRTEYPEND